MKNDQIKRFVITVVIMLACYLLQCTLFPSLELASVKPNLLLIVTAAYGFIARAENRNVDRNFFRDF